MIIIPAAGKGQRFKDAGYTQPKHLIPLDGKTMIQRVIENLLPLDPDGGVRVLRRAEVGETRGTAETLSKVDNRVNGPVVIANCDQLIKLPDHPRLSRDGTIFTFRSVNPSHSYVLVNQESLITKIVEKEVISDRAVSGVYWFKDETILDYCSMITSSSTRGELFLSHAISRMVNDGYSFYECDVATAILGTPEDLQRWEVARCF